MAAVYVCICNGVTERAIREAARAGARSVSDLTVMTGCGSTCGSCVQVAQEILDAARGVPLPLPLYAAAA